MAVTEVNLLTTRVQGQESGHRTYTSVARVFTDDANDGASTVMISSLLPQIGEPYLWRNSFDYGARVNSLPVVRLEREDGNARKIWLATITYTTRGRQEEVQPPDDPLNHPWKVSGDSDEWVEEAERDINGVPLMNSSFQQLRGKQVERFRSRRKWVLTKNYPYVNTTIINYFEKSVNRNVVWLFDIPYPPRTLYMRRITFTREWFGYNQQYWPHTFYIDVDMDTFDRKIVDKGTMQAVDITATNDPAQMTAITDPVTEDQVERYLNGNARVLPAGAAPVILNAPNGFQLYEPEEWNVIGFPSV